MRYIILTILIVLASMAGASWQDDVKIFFDKIEYEHFTPKLNFLYTDSVGEIVSQRFTDVNMPANKPDNLVIIVHGWIEQLDWPEDMAKDIYRHVDSNDWLVGWYDWRSDAVKITPTLAAEFGRDVGGRDVANTILNFKNDFKHVHLIGHSAGSWVITSAGKEFWQRTSADIHLTFLDAFVPDGWDVNDVGLKVADPNRNYWADHYYTRDITWLVTEPFLPNCHNVDLSEVDPGLNDHLLPMYWYHATVIDKYPEHWFYKYYRLFSVANHVHYGFDLSLENGKGSWQKALGLKLDDKVIIVEPKMPIYNPFESLY